MFKQFWKGMRAMKKFNMSDVFSAYKVQLFTGEWLYTNHETETFDQHPQEFVNGKAKIDPHHVIRKYEIDEIYPYIKQAVGVNGDLLASRLIPSVDLAYPKSVGKPREPTTYFFLKGGGFSVERLTETQKKQVLRELEKEGISYCRFIDKGRFTIIKTTASGYRVLAYLQKV